MLRKEQILSILFVILQFVFCNNPEITTPPEKVSAKLSVISGKNQAGTDGETLPEPVVIMVTDVTDMPLEDVQINSIIIDGGGSLDSYTSRSDSQGNVEIHWTLGYGQEHVLKAAIHDEDFSGDPVYVFAQTVIDIQLEWTSDIDFPNLFGMEITHDNRILESNHFLVFSDESSDDAKVRFTKIAEETFHEVMQAYHLNSSEELGIVESATSSKPKLFSNVDTTFPYGGFAFNTGYVYYALDSNTYIQGSNYLHSIYRPDIKHETVHIIQFLVGLDNLPNLWPDVWFSEGIAVYISNNRPPIASLQELDEWRQNPSNDNPIKVHEWSDYPPGGRRYYHMFGLAVMYLLHEEGHGKTTTDVLDMYRYMVISRNGFADAFERYMGMSVPYYEEHFWDLIKEFLD
jgi:hypothetical protein